MIVKRKDIISRFIPPIIGEGYNEPFSLENCIVDTIDLCSANFNEIIVIKNCVIRKLELSSTFFEQGLDFSNNIVKELIIFEAGGHNNKPIIFTNNIFNDFFCFFDCNFYDEVIVKDNIFRSGSDLLTKEDPNFDNMFNRGVEVENNLGCLNISPELGHQMLCDSAKLGVRK